MQYIAEMVRFCTRFLRAPLIFSVKSGCTPCSLATQQTDVGGLLSEATGGDFATGALTAGANEALIEQLSGVIKGDRNLELAISQLIGIGAATVTDGDYTKAAELAKNATAYNRQLHPEEVKRLRSQAGDLAEEAGISQAEAERRLAEAQAYFVDETFRQTIEASGAELDETTLRHLGMALAPLAHQYDVAASGDVPVLDDPNRVYSPAETLALLQSYHVNHADAFSDSLMYAEYLHGMSGAAHDQRALYEANLNYSDGVDLLGSLKVGLAGGQAAVVEKIQGFNELALALMDDFSGTSEQLTLALLAAAASPDQVVGDFLQAKMDAENQAYLHRLQGDHESAAYVEEKWKTEFALNFVAAGRAGALGRVGGTKGTGTAAAHGSASSLRLSTQLAYEEAGILIRGGVGITQEAVAASREIPISGGRLTNPVVVKELTANVSKIEDWGKFTTQSIALPSGQRSQIHYYMNRETGEVNLNVDFKVKGVVQ